jgi:putative DNA primase/helicase
MHLSARARLRGSSKPYRREGLALSARLEDGIARLLTRDERIDGPDAATLACVITAVIHINALWPNDTDSIKALQEWFGYVLSGRTDLHKIFLMIGPPRSGRGTIARILEAMIGKGNSAASTLASLGTNFGLAPLIGKPLTVVGDVRLGSANEHQVVERLLSISGEDLITIDRKYAKHWTGKLPTRFMLISNELPRLGDSSGAMATRFVVVQLEESFLGREDRALDAKLRAELTGILNWALEGLDRIIRQPFTVPKASDDAIRDLQVLVSPISAFVGDFCDRGRDKTVKAQDLYAAWRQDCEDNGHRATASSVFGRDLRSVMPTLRHYQPHGQPRQHVGLELKAATDRYSTAYTTHTGEKHVSPVSPVSMGLSETGETGENPLWGVYDDALQASGDDPPSGSSGEATTNGQRTHCHMCGAELRPHLQARGTCGPCHFKAGSTA